MVSSSVLGPAYPVELLHFTVQGLGMSLLALWRLARVFGPIVGWSAGIVHIFTRERSNSSGVVCCVRFAL